MKDNVSTHMFGPNWIGQTCGAKTQSGTPCKRPARTSTNRCKLHGGASAGPATTEGLASVSKARTKNGRYVSEKRIEAKRRLEIGKEVDRQALEIESWALERGLLPKNWRNLFR